MQALIMKVSLPEVIMNRCPQRESGVNSDVSLVIQKDGDQDKTKRIRMPVISIKLNILVRTNPCHSTSQRSINFVFCIPFMIIFICSIIQKNKRIKGQRHHKCPIVSLGKW